jgi:hypothetical protein
VRLGVHHMSWTMKNLCIIWYTFWGVFSRSDLNTDLIKSWTYSAKFAPILLPKTFFS